MISEELSPEEKARIIASITDLYDTLKLTSGISTFEDVINLLIKKYGLNKAKASFNGFVRSWKFAKLPGYQTLNSDEIYNKLFNSNDVMMDDFMNLTRQLPSQKQEEEKTAINPKSNENKILEERPKSQIDRWIYNDERRLRTIWYLVFPIILGLILEWFYKLPLSFNWPVFLLFSTTCLTTLILFDKKISNLLTKINRDIKIVLTTILVLLILGVLTATVEYTNYVAEYFNMKNSHAIGLSFLIYIIIFLIYSLWETPKEE